MNINLKDLIENSFSLKFSSVKGNSDGFIQFKLNIDLYYQKYHFISMSFIYNKKDAKCMWCKRTRNPHKDFNETIPTKIFISHKKRYTKNYRCS